MWRACACVRVGLWAYLPACLWMGGECTVGAVVVVVCMCVCMCVWGGWMGVRAGLGTGMVDWWQLAGRWTGGCTKTL